MAKHLEIYRGESEPEARCSFLWLHTVAPGVRALEEYNGSSWVPISSSDLASKIGDLSELDTETKTSIVEALNEVAASKLEKPSTAGEVGKALLVGPDGKPIWGNIEIASGAVLYNDSQVLTDEQKAQARDNINSASKVELDGKVDKVAGKGLSSEDYTAAEKGKVANIPADTNAELADIVAESTDRKALELLCGQPPILFGAGTPQEAIVPDNWKQFDPETGEGYNWNGNPSAIGQQYINTSVVSGGRYVAGRTSYDKASANYYVLKWYNS